MVEKIYYQDQYLLSCTAVVNEVREDGIIFDRTVAFPEGGGQIGDTGILINTVTGEEVVFINTQKIRGKKSTLEEFQALTVGTDIVHQVALTDILKFSPEAQWKIKVDGERRAKITANHSGTHLLFLAVDKVRPGYYQRQNGARITDEYGRMDFSTTEKFNANEIKAIEEIIREYIEKKLDIRSYSHEVEKEAIYWECDGEIIPCGGTHLTSTSFLKGVSIKRKSIGKEADRLIAQFEISPEIYSQYHE